MRRHLFLCVILVLLSSASIVRAQSFGISTNVPSLALGNINIEPSIGLGPRLSLHLSMQVRPFKYALPMPAGMIHPLYNHGVYGSNERLSFSKVTHSENITFTPSFRYWTKGTYNRGIFFGVNGIASLYKFGSDKFDPNYSKGYYYGGGLSAGYSHELSKHWNIEVELGGSVIRTRYDLLNDKDVVIRKDLSRTLILPTRMSLSIVYVP